MHRAIALPAFVLLLVVLSPGPLAGECNSAPSDADEFITGLGPQTIDVLANAADSNQGQLLTVAVTSSTCPGSVTVDFEMIQFDPEPRIYADCRIVYSVQDDLGQSDSSRVFITMPTHIFSDGFEIGSTSNWSTASQ